LRTRFPVLAIGQFQVSRLVERIWKRLDPLLTRYFIGIIVVVVYSSTAAYIGLGLVLRLQQAPTLALTTGLLETIPMIGPMHQQVLTSAATIAFGGALVVSASAVCQLLTARSVAARFPARGSMLSFAASGVAAGSSGIQGMAGLAVIVLGILAISGTASLTLTLVALLVAGAALVMTGSTLSGTMIGLMRSSPRERVNFAQRG
jgi:hypothetical protein